ncbi:MAG: tol-pal system-associated acyl-CoA thioesterase [Methylophilaceae bacterium]|nr:tol-pal system-associated acyl-CoA thioesterase [Methylophilaceae bacterium]
MSDFIWPVRVYYEDTDGGGVVYHANYLKFMERARTEWLRSLGFEQTELKTELGILFVVRGLSLRFRHPACFNDALCVVSRLSKIGHCLLEFEQIIQRDAVQLTTAKVEVACVDTQHFKPIALPQIMRQKFTEL